MLILSEEFLEKRQYSSGHDLCHQIHEAGDLRSFEVSLVDLHERGNLGVRLFSRRQDKLPCGIAPDEISVAVSFPVALDDLEISEGCRIEDRECDMPVLIDVYKFVENSQTAMLHSDIFEVIRLKPLNLVYCVDIDAIKTMPLKSVFKSFRSRTDGKLISIRGMILCGQNKFPHQVIECRSQILQTIAKQERDSGWGRSLRPENESRCIKGALLLSYQCAWISLEIPSQLTEQIPRMAMRMEKLIFD